MLFFVVVVVTFQFFPSFLLLNSNHLEKKASNTLFIPFHSIRQTSTHESIWIDLIFVLSHFFFYWLFFSWAHFNFFPLLARFSKAVDVTFISIYFDRISNWIAIMASKKKWVWGKNLWGNLQWDHFIFLYFKQKKNVMLLWAITVAWKEQAVWLMVDWMLLQQMKNLFWIESNRIDNIKTRVNQTNRIEFSWIPRKSRQSDRIFFRLCVLLLYIVKWCLSTFNGVCTH